MQLQRKCIHHPDNFCYICGQFTTKTQQNKIYSITKTAYHLYFGCKIGDQDKAWAPHICCITCTSNLRQWLHGKRKRMPFAIPMIWRDPRNHIDDCYFCMTKISGMSKKSKHIIVYPNIPSAIRPVQHSDNLPVPVPPKTWKEITSEESNEESGEEQADEDYQQEMSNKPHLIKQEELSDLIRDLNLSKDQAEILGSNYNNGSYLKVELK